MVGLADEVRRIIDLLNNDVVTRMAKVARADELERLLDALADEPKRTLTTAAGLKRDESTMTTEQIQGVYDDFSALGIGLVEQMELLQSAVEVNRP